MRPATAAHAPVHLH